MTFPGVKDAQQRIDLVAFLKQATQPGRASSPRTAQQNRQMGGMMGGGDLNLKTAGPEHRVQAISYCRDTYRVTTADGKTRAFWERSLRLMVDGSENGPPSGARALVDAGMMGDRADAIFAAPEEISSFIKHESDGTRCLLLTRSGGSLRCNDTCEVGVNRKWPAYSRNDATDIAVIETAGFAEPKLSGVPTPLCSDFRWQDVSGEEPG